MKETRGCTYEQKEFEPIDFNLSTVKDKVKFEEAIQNLDQKGRQSHKELRKKKADRDSINAKLKSRDYVRYDVYYKREQLQYLKEALDELQESTTEGNCRTIQKLCHRMQNMNNNSVEEKRILRAIKHASEEREKVLSDADNEQRKTYHWILGRLPDSRGGIKDLINRVIGELQELSKKEKPFIAYERKLRKELKTAEKDICLIERQLKEIGKKRTQLYCHTIQLGTEYVV